VRVALMEAAGPAPGASSYEDFSVSAHRSDPQEPAESPCLRAGAPDSASAASSPPARSSPGTASSGNDAPRPTRCFPQSVFTSRTSTSRSSTRPEGCFTGPHCLERRPPRRPPGRRERRRGHHRIRRQPTPTGPLEPQVALMAGEQVFLAVVTVAELRYGALVAGWGAAGGSNSRSQRRRSFQSAIPTPPPASSASPGGSRGRSRTRRNVVARTGRTPTGRGNTPTTSKARFADLRSSSGADTPHTDLRLPAGHRHGVRRQLVERHLPAGGARRVGGNTGMRQGHAGAAAEVGELHAHLGDGRVSVGHTCLGR